MKMVVKKKKMNLLMVGQIEILMKLKSLKKGWDGNKAKPIKKTVINKFRDMSFLMNKVNLFKKIGFCESNIEVIPIPDGNIQLEAESKTMYLEITIE